MRLIKEQVTLLELEKEELMKELKNSKVSIEKIDTQISFGRYDNSLVELKKQLIIIDTRIRKINNILEEAEVVESSSIEKINIGSNVELFIDFGEDSDYQDDNYLSFILIEKKVGKESSESFITIESDIGKAIFGKRVGDKFSYQLYNGQQVNGIIMNISSEKENSVIKKKDGNENKIQFTT